MFDVLGFCPQPMFSVLARCSGGLLPPLVHLAGGLVLYFHCFALSGFKKIQSYPHKDKCVKMHIVHSSQDVLRWALCVQSMVSGLGPGGAVCGIRPCQPAFPGRGRSQLMGGKLHSLNRRFQRGRGS